MNADFARAIDAGVILRLQHLLVLLSYPHLTQLYYGLPFGTWLGPHGRQGRKKPLLFADSQPRAME